MTRNARRLTALCALAVACSAAAPAAVLVAADAPSSDCAKNCIGAIRSRPCTASGTG